MNIEIPIISICLCFCFLSNHRTQRIVRLLYKLVYTRLYIVRNLCLIANCSIRPSHTSLVNWGALFKTITKGMPKRMTIRSYTNCATSVLTKFFKVQNLSKFCEIIRNNNNKTMIPLGEQQKIHKSIPYFSNGPNERNRVQVAAYCGSILKYLTHFITFAKIKSINEYCWPIGAHYKDFLHYNSSCKISPTKAFMKLS